METKNVKMELEFEEITIKVPKNTVALAIASIYEENKINGGLGMHSVTLDTEDLKKIKKVSD